MEDGIVCRICLNIEVKMQDLLSYPLDTYFSSITIEYKPSYALPQFVCYECAALVKKYYFFRQKCVRSQGLLCRMIDEYGKITSAAIKSMNRQTLLTVSNLANIDIEQENTNSLDIDKPEIIVEVIKKEDHDEVDIPDHITPDDSSSTDDDDGDDDWKENYGKKKIKDIEKVEIHVKMDIQEEFDSPELAETTVIAPKLPVKRTRSAQSKKQSRLKRTRPTVTKRMPTRSKVIKDDMSDDKNNMDDITVVTLSKEEQAEEINKRKVSSNYLNCPYKCHLCYRGFNNTGAWKHHLAKHSPNAGDIECPICKYRFKSKRNLQRHSLNHEKKYICKLCPYFSSNITTVKQHQGSHKGITYKCDFCDEVFNVRTTYVSHMRIKHPSEYICGYCGYSFYSKQGLRVHKNMVHIDIMNKPENNEDSEYCAECDVNFISSEAYNRHWVMSAKHTQNANSINGCRVCGAKFKDSEELRVHHRKEHPKRQPRHYTMKTTNTQWPAKCEHCSEEIGSARAYYKHFRLMHPNENYPLQKKSICDICGKRFMCNALLVMHKRTHFGERPYKCTQCDKACFTPNDLRMHQQKHSDTRPFPCNICSAAFKRKEALERHLKIHSGDNPYKCEICGVAFNKSCTRTLHVRTVHTKEPAPPRKRRNKLTK